MTVPNENHTAHPWRIHGLTEGFHLEDVWELPTPAGPNDFPRLVEMVTRGGAGWDSSPLARSLFAIRWFIGRLLGWDRPTSNDGGPQSSLKDRLPQDLQATSSVPEFRSLPFTSLYLLDDEYAAEIINRTVHGVMHLGWVADGTGGFRGRMAVYAKPNGWLGSAYMKAITPFRRLIVYPAMLRQIESAWQATAGHERRP